MEHKHILVCLHTYKCAESLASDTFVRSPELVAFGKDPVDIGRCLAVQMQGVVVAVYGVSNLGQQLSLGGGSHLQVFCEDRVENPWSSNQAIRDTAKGPRYIKLCGQQQVDLAKGGRLGSK